MNKNTSSLFEQLAGGGLTLRVVGGFLAGGCMLTTLDMFIREVFLL